MENSDKEQIKSIMFKMVSIIIAVIIVAIVWVITYSGSINKKEVQPTRKAYCNNKSGAFITITEEANDSYGFEEEIIGNEENWKFLCNSVLHGEAHCYTKSTGLFSNEYWIEFKFDVNNIKSYMSEKDSDVDCIVMDETEDVKDIAGSWCRSNEDESTSSYHRYTFNADNTVTSTFSYSSKKSSYQNSYSSDGYYIYKNNRIYIVYKLPKNFSNYDSFQFDKDEKVVKEHDWIYEKCE